MLKDPWREWLWASVQSMQVSGICLCVLLIFILYDNVKFGIKKPLFTTNLLKIDNFGTKSNIHVHILVLIISYIALKSIHCYLTFYKICTLCLLVILWWYYCVTVRLWGTLYNIYHDVILCFKLCFLCSSTAQSCSETETTKKYNDVYQFLVYIQ